jgi:phosphoribosyl-ATP pyrophosphohydrolase
MAEGLGSGRGIRNAADCAKGAGGVRPHRAARRRALRSVPDAHFVALATGRYFVNVPWGINAPVRQRRHQVTQRFTLDSLEAIVADRASHPADVSYTAKLLAKGLPHCAKKLGEEAVEATLAAVAGDDDALVGETCDLLYHLMVVLRARQITLATVYDELERRTAWSGLEEKARRPAD